MTLKIKACVEAPEMSNEIKPYPTYKVSKLPWLHSIPSHWEEKRAKYYLREVDERSQSGAEELLSVSHITGVTPRSQKNVTMFKAESYIGSKLCRRGDVVINTMWAWMAAMGVAWQEGIVSPSYGVYRPMRLDTFVPVYLDHLLRAQPYATEYLCRSTGIRSSRLRLYPDKFLDIPIVCPPRREQELIISYLHYKTQQVKRFVRNQQRLIKLLDEQKQAIIDRAVTRGLDPNVPLKPSGIEWLNEVPEHWQRTKVKFLAGYLNGFPFNPRQWSDTGKRIIRIQNLTDPSSEYNYFRGKIGQEYLVHPGDILLSWSASLGVFVWQNEPAWLNQHIFKVSPRESIVTKGYYVWLARWFLGHMSRDVHGSTMQHLTKPKFGSFPVFLPPIEEQQRIEDFLSQEESGIDQAIDRAEREIDLIREYRTRLISDVVTGQLDVRHLAEGLEAHTVDEDGADWDDIAEEGFPDEMEDEDDALD